METARLKKKKKSEQDEEAEVVEEVKVEPVDEGGVDGTEKKKDKSE
jgi:hypothetical protein